MPSNGCQSIFYDHLNTGNLIQKRNIVASIVKVNEICRLILFAIKIVMKRGYTKVFAFQAMKISIFYNLHYWPLCFQVGF